MKLLFGRSMFAATVSTLALLCTTSSLPASAQEPTGTPVSHVFSMTNDPTSNSVLVWTRNQTDGSLSLTQTVPTGGKGSGSILMSQGSILSASHYLFVVNAGSNTITVLTIGNTKLAVVSTISSGGTFPLSMTYFEGRLYVVNQNNNGNIAGFTFNTATGVLTSIAGSTQPLSGAVNPQPAEIGFMKNGTALIVTEKLTNKIDIYPVNGTGVAGPPTTYSANAPTPYGFATGSHARFYVTEANGTVPFASSVSSYTLPANNIPQLITGSVSTAQSAACWIALNTAYTFAYVTDNESDVLSVLSINANGQLALLPAFNVDTRILGAPFDDALSADGKFLYVLYPSTGSIGVYAVNANGSLTQTSVGTGAVGTSSGIWVK